MMRYNDPRISPIQEEEAGVAIFPSPMNPGRTHTHRTVRNLPAEHRLVLAAAGAAGEGELPPPADEREILAHARRTGLSGILAWRLLETRPAGFPIPSATLTATIARERKTLIARNLLLLERLGEIALALDRAGTEWLVVKGPALLRYYPEPGTRSFGDLDILVRPRDIPAAEASLAAHGYRFSACHHPRRHYIERHFHLPLARADDTRPTVELHWALDHPGGHSRFNVDRLFSRAVPASAGNVTFRTLSPEDTLLHLALHYALSELEPLRILLDFHRASAGIPVGPSFIREAGRVRLRRAFDFTRAAAQAVWGASVPDTPFPRIFGMNRNLLARLILQTESPPERIWREWAKLSLCDSPVGRLRMLGRALLAPPSRRHHRAGPESSPRRLLRLAQELLRNHPAGERPPLVEAPR
ncbi:MAG: nucleotidyltransferase family protein [Planctomycetota bacterium]